MASICRTLASWALMLSRRWVAAASSRSDSERIRSTRATASATICSAFCSASAISWADLASGLAGGPVGLGPQLFGVLLGGPELRLGLRGALLEVLLGLVPPLGQRLLEVVGRLRRLGPLLLVDRLGLLPAGDGLPVRLVHQLLGRPLGVLDDPGRLALGADPGLGGVPVGVGPGLGGAGLEFGELAPDLDGGRRADLGRLVAGQGEDLPDPLTEVGEGRLGRLDGRLGGGLPSGCLGRGQLLGAAGLGGGLLLGGLHRAGEFGDPPLDLLRVVTPHDGTELLPAAVAHSALIISSSRKRELVASISSVSPATSAAGCGRLSFWPPGVRPGCARPTGRLIRLCSAGPDG